MAEQWRTRGPEGSFRRRSGGSDRQGARRGSFGGPAPETSELVGTNSHPRGLYRHAKNAKALADEIEEIWSAADAEGRDLTAGERIHMSELVVEAKSQHNIEKQIREIGPAAASQFRDPPPTRTRRIRAAARATCSSVGRVPADPGSVRPRPDVDDGARSRFRRHACAASRARCSRRASAAPAAGRSRRMYEPGIVDKLFEPLGVRDVFGQSTTTASQVRYVDRGHRALRAPRVWPRAARSPSRRSTWPRSSSRSRRSPRSSRSRTSSSRTHRRSSPT